MIGSYVVCVNESGSAASYIVQLETLIQNPALRRTLGHSARQSVLQSFTDFETALQTEAVYRRLLR